MSTIRIAHARPPVPAWLPAVGRHARRAFRSHPPADRDEFAAAAVALAWEAAVRLAARGKDPAAFPATVVKFAVLAVLNGRRVGGGATTRDVLEPAARRRRGFTFRSLDDPRPGGGWWRDLVADPRTPVPAQAAFNLDFPAWLAALPPRLRRIARLLARGLGTAQAAARLGVTPARVSQVRRELAAAWHAFHGEAVAD
jgi:DNA-binding NarL/FixJ family response regulator